MLLEIKGKRALFSRPELKVERHSYDVPTPSAIMGILKAVYWKPEMDYLIKKIVVVNEPKFESIMTNAFDAAMESNVAISNLKNGTVKSVCRKEHSSPRNMRVLMDVHYVVEFDIILTHTATSEDDCKEKHIAIFCRRVQKGQSFVEPCLGVKEFTCDLRLLSGDELPESNNKGTVHLGTMLHHIDYSNQKPKPVFYKPIMRNGVIDVNESSDSNDGWLFTELCKFYDKNKEKYEFPMMGYSTEKIHYEAVLNESGEMIELNALNKDEKGKIKPMLLTVPEMVKGRTSGIKANFIYDNGSYVFALDEKNGTEKQKAFLDKLVVVVPVFIKEIEILKCFLKSFDIHKYFALFEPFMNKDKIEFNGNVIFRIKGQDCYIHELPAVQEYWSKYYLDNLNTNTGVCSVTGKEETLADMHAVIKGVTGANAFTKLVSVNSAMTAYNSYGMIGLENSPMSVNVVHKYTTALNWLLSQKNHRVSIGKSTFVYWTSNENEKLLHDIKYLLLGLKEDKTNDNTIVPEGEEFYIAELRANSARLVVNGFNKFVFGRSAKQVENFCISIRRLYNGGNIKQDWDFIFNWQGGSSIMNNSVGYMLGELFAMLEKSQYDAVKSTRANKGIAELYIEKASKIPNKVFPKLLALNIHHLNKVDYGMSKKISEKLKELECFDEPFPDRLTNKEQCIFYMGYRQMRNTFFKKDEVSANE